MAYPRECVLAILLYLSSIAPLWAAERDKSVIGQWKLTKVLDSSEITALNDTQAQALVGRLFDIQSSKVQFGKRVCKAPSFEVTHAETIEYFKRQAHASADQLGLPNPVTAVHLSCTYVYKKAPNRLVVHWKGYFFDAVKQK